MSGLFLKARVEGIQFWQSSLANNIRGGVYTEAVVVPQTTGSLFEIRGKRTDGTVGSMVAKFGDQGRANDAALVVNNLAKVDPKLN